MRLRRAPVGAAHGCTHAVHDATLPVAPTPGNPFDLAARSLSTLRNMALVGATTAASGMALLQQLRETEVPGFLCRMGRKCLVTSA